MKMLIDAVLKISLCFGDSILFYSIPEEEMKILAGDDSGKHPTRGKHALQSQICLGRAIFSEGDHMEVIPACFRQGLLPWMCGQRCGLITFPFLQQLSLLTHHSKDVF